MKKDLFILVPDRDIEETIRVILKRNIKGVQHEIQFDIVRDSNHDAGVRTKASEWLRPQLTEYKCAIVIFDYHGCGEEHTKTPEEIEESTKEILAKNGWEKKRILVCVLDPEFEGIIWTTSGSFAKNIGFNSVSQMKEALLQRKIEMNNFNKPCNPKDVMQKLMSENSIQKSASLYGKIASEIRLQDCRHPICHKLMEFLQYHFSKDADPRNPNN